MPGKVDVMRRHEHNRNAKTEAKAGKELLIAQSPMANQVLKCSWAAITLERGKVIKNRLL